MRKTIQSTLIDVIGLGGAGSISYGAWLVYEPAGFIVGGVLMLAIAILISRGSR